MVCIRLGWDEKEEIIGPPPPGAIPPAGIPMGAERKLPDLVGVG